MGSGKATEARASPSPSLILGKTCAGPGCLTTQFLIWGTYVDDDGLTIRYTCCRECGDGYAKDRQRKRALFPGKVLAFERKAA